MTVLRPFLIEDGHEMAENGHAKHDHRSKTLSKSRTRPPFKK